MKLLRSSWNRILGLRQRGQQETEMSDEFDSHIAMQTDDNLRAGMDPATARRQARLKFGSLEEAKERWRDQQRIPLLESAWFSVRYAARTLSRSPGFTAVAILTLALGIGANTAIFSVINGILLKPLSYPDAEQLVLVGHATNLEGSPRWPNSPATYFTYREGNQVFQDFGVFSGGTATVTGLAEPERVQTLSVTFGVLPAFGVQPALGRWFSEADDSPGTPETVLLTYGYWQRRYGGDRSVIGQSITLDSLPREIIGVMAESFRPLHPDWELIIPLRFDRSTATLNNFRFPGLARLKPGVTLDQAGDDIERMIAIWPDAWTSLTGTGPEFYRNAGFAPHIQELKERVVGDISNLLWVLMATIGIVLLIACANVANLLLVRAEGRQPELAIRAALGAGRGRIARSMLVESLLLGILGGTLGLGLAHGGLLLLVSNGPATLPRLSEISIDPVVLTFTLAVSLLTAVLFGLAPVLRYAGTQPGANLGSVGRRLSQTQEKQRAGNLLVVAQVALVLVLLVGSGLMIRTFQALLEVDPGFTNAASVQMFQVAMSEGQVSESEQVIRMQNEILERLEALPSVQSVAFGTSVPMAGFGQFETLYVEDKIYRPGETPPVRRQVFAAPGYFATLGTPLITGRDLTWTDIYDGRNVAIVSENLARETWGEPQAALGKRIRTHNSIPWREVIGVAGDIYYRGVQEEVSKTVYWRPLDDAFTTAGGPFSGRTTTFLIRSDRAATESFLAEIRETVWSVDRDLPLTQGQTLDEAYSKSMARTSFTLVMLGLAGVMGLLIAVVGTYGVISYAVSKRFREMGIRLALGAETAQLIRMFVGNALLLAGFGILIGTAAAAALSPLMESLLFEISPLDPLTYIAVAVALMSVAGIASYLPARRVVAMNPANTLRAE